MYVLLIGILFYPLSMIAFPTVVPDPIACVSELELHFFKQPFVNQALSLYNVRQELWLPIDIRLQQKSLEVPTRLKRRTAYMVPNPLEYPMQRAKVGEVLKEILFEVLKEVMKEYYLDKEYSTPLIFNYIFDKQLASFNACFDSADKF